jgi:hypothetical protein
MKYRCGQQLVEETLAHCERQREFLAPDQRALIDGRRDYQLAISLRDSLVREKRLLDALETMWTRFRYDGMTGEQAEALEEAEAALAAYRQEAA